MIAQDLAGNSTELNLLGAVDNIREVLALEEDGYLLSFVAQGILTELVSLLVLAFVQ